MTVCVIYFVNKAKVLDMAAYKPTASETGHVPKSPAKSSTASTSSSPPGSTLAPPSPTSLSLSTGEEPDNQDYILLDECYSGTGTSPIMSTSSSATPSPGNTLARGIAPPVEYQNLVGSANGKSLDELPSSENILARGNETPVEYQNVIISTDSKSLDEFSIQSASSSAYGSMCADAVFEGVPSLPAKTDVSDVEYDVPAMMHGYGFHPSAKPMHSSPVPPPPPPQPHMAVPGRMHRYVNAPPMVVRSQTPTSATIQKNYSESSSYSIQAHTGLRPAPQSATSRSPVLPPKAHGQ